MCLCGSSRHFGTIQNPFGRKRLKPYFCTRLKLGYGVKVAQQILILFV